MTSDSPAGSRSSGEEVVIRSVTVAGNGVGTLPDGMTVFVPRAAPGDRIAVGGVVRRRRHATGRIARLIEAGPGRADPPCPHYLADRCGACQLMHLDYPTQLAVKGTIVGDALRRIGRIPAPDPPVEGTRPVLGYRSKVTYAVRGGRIGYHRVDGPDEVFEVERCLLAAPEVDRLHQHLRSARELLPTDAVRLVLRCDGTGGRHLVIERTGRERWRYDPALAPSDTTVWEWNDGRPRAVAGERREWPVTAFEQVNPGVAAALRAAAVASLGDLRGMSAWDLYAGVGETSMLLAGAGARVESIELDAGAVALAERRGPAGVRRLAGDVGALIDRLGPPDAVVTNPPRTGMSREAVAGLVRSGAARIAYVSCDPATLARDLAGLSERYLVAGVRAVDQFPQTAHVETLATLIRRED